MVTPDLKKGEDFFVYYLNAAHQNGIEWLKKLKGVPCNKAIIQLNDIFTELSSRKFDSSDAKDEVMPHFILRSRAAYLAGVRLAISGQSVEAYPILRLCLEFSLYAYFIFVDKNSVEVDHDSEKIKVPERFMIWLDRRKDAESKRLFLKTFTMGNLKGAISEVDKKLGDIVGNLYDNLIDFGAHPNFETILGHQENEGGLQISYFLPPTEDIHKKCIQDLASTGICALLIFRWMYKEFFDIVNLTQQLDLLKSAMPKTFKS